jgi:type II secretory pathway pseudopilin PulG
MNRQSGFTYLAILFAIAIVGIALAVVGENATQANQREKEVELLFIGNQYRQAIMLYYERTPGAVKHFPAKLEDLLTDQRYNPPQHYLRKLYRDPITNQSQWGLVMSPEGGIMGVHSLSNATPIKQTNFAYSDIAFEGAAKYSDWVFAYVPQILNSTNYPVQGK